MSDIIVRVPRLQVGGNSYSECRKVTVWSLAYRARGLELENPFKASDYMRVAVVPNVSVGPRNMVRSGAFTIVQALTAGTLSAHISTGEINNLSLLRISLAIKEMLGVWRYTQRTQLH